MKGNAADDLDVKVAHARCPARCLPDCGKRLGQKVVERLAVLDTLTEELGLAAQFLVVHRTEAWLKVVHARGDALILLEVLVGSGG